MLLDVCGRPLLARHLEHRKRLGIGRVVINTHQRTEQIEAAALD